MRTDMRDLPAVEEAVRALSEAERRAFQHCLTALQNKVLVHGRVQRLAVAVVYFEVRDEDDDEEKNDPRIGYPELYPGAPG